MSLDACIQMPDNVIASGKQDWEKPLFRDIGMVKTVKNSGYEIIHKLIILLIYPVGCFIARFPQLLRGHGKHPTVDGAEK